jgi:hypothetical protein
MPSRRERLLDSHLAQLETTEQRAARQVAAAYGQARRELIATLVGGWNGTGVDTPDQAAARLRQLALLDQIDARVQQLERETGLILRGLLNVAAEQGVTQIRREIALLPPSLRPENTLMFATINERMVERYAPAALDGLRAGTTDLGITLRRELQTGLLQGESFPNLVGRLLRATPEGEGTAVFPRARTSAELATRRAVITAENAAKVAAIGEVATQDPLIRKQAIAVIGKGTTDCCLRVHGQIKRNDEPFELVGEPRFADRMMAPSFHWNCRTGVAMYHPAFEESMPTAKLEQDAKAEQKRRREERAERSRNADERAAARAARAEREAAERAAAERARIAGLSDDEARAELTTLIGRIREAEAADNEALGDQLREQQRVYIEVLEARRKVEQAARLAREAAERAAREAEQARQAASSVPNATAVTVAQDPDAERLVGLAQRTRDAVHQLPQGITPVNVNVIDGLLDGSQTVNGSYKLDIMGQLPHERGIEMRKEPRMEFVYHHEFGHYLDHQYLQMSHEMRYYRPNAARPVPEELRQEFWSTVRQTSVVKNLETQRDNLFDSRPPNSDSTPEERYYRYLASEAEVWARAYSQYIAQRSGRMQQDYQAKATQWSEQEFAPVASVIDRIFERLGLR